MADYRNEQFLDAVMEHSFDGIYITDGKANTIKVNRAYLTISGLQKSEVEGRNMQALVEDGTISESGTLMVIARRHPVTLTQQFKTGKRALITSSPIFDDTGEVVCVITNVRDITELYRLNEETSQWKHEEKKLKQELAYLRSMSETDEYLVAEDKKTRQIIQLLNRVAPLDTTVILLGETGVGKEVFSKYIYQHSNRKGKPYIKVNCGAIPPNLVESELFGYEHGAFTGADKNGKIGLFEVADHGTIFLDEVGELPLDMQVKLLRVLQEQQFERVGSRKTVKVDVRVLAATNRNLEEMVRQKLFREDLYYRLMVFPVSIPPLRERQTDIMPLAENFLGELNKKYGFNKSFAPMTSAMLQTYQWPGNIRELKNIIERAVIISNEDQLMPETCQLFGVGEKSFGAGLTSGIQLAGIDAAQSSQTGGKNLKSAVEALEWAYIKQAYEQYGNVRDAAASLGLTPATFVRKRQRYEKQ